MKELRQVVLGVIAALLSSAIVLGSLALVLVESGFQLALLPTPTQTPAPMIPTPLPGLPTFTPTPNLSPTPAPTSTSPPCLNRPPDWIPTLVYPDDTIESLAATYGITSEELIKGNCLDPAIVQPGSYLFVPPSTPTPTLTDTPTPTRPIATRPPSKPNEPCGPFPGWVPYSVQRGDTLYGLGLAFGVDYHLIQQANCLGNNDVIRVGQRLWVPNVPTRIPRPTATLRPSLTPRPTSTRQFPTAPPVPSDTPVPTNTPKPATNTPETPTAAPTNPPLTFNPQAAYFMQRRGVD